MTAPDASPQSDDDPERPTLEKRVQDALWTAGCLFVLGMILLLGALGLRVLGPWWLLALCIGLIVGTIYGVIAVHRIRNRRAVRGFHRAFGTLGKDHLLVTSDSPHWKDYIERHWLPRWGSRAVVINWSERSRWEETRPEIALFRRFKGGLEYNPLAIVDEAEARLADYLVALDHGRSLHSLPPESEDPDDRRESLRREFKKRSGAK